MYKLKTDKEILTTEDIVGYIKDYESSTVKQFDKLWQYYLGKNPTILGKRATDPNNPDNRTPVSYGRKIITTFTGYAYRPRYITYKSDNEAFLEQLMLTFNENNEHIKNSIHGRNTGVFGVSYELLYLDKSILTGKPEVKFSVIDPREFILLYDYSMEPKKKIGIRYYCVGGDKYKVIVYYPSSTEYYNGERDRSNEIKLTFEKSEGNYFKELPIIAYYLGNEIQGLIEPVIPLIDNYDLLISDSMNEFDRYSHAYLRLVGMSLSDQSKSASPGVFQSALNLLKRRRVFEQLKNKDDVTFLTKDIPTAYIEFMAGLIRDQIHIQSHVPDLGSSAFKDGVSGVAIQRLMFDFENVVSNAEAEFDTALLERIRLITNVYKTTNRADGTFDEITISHKRNAPVNLMEYADISLKMEQAGFSDYSKVDIWPDDIFPNVEAELERQKEDREGAIPDIETIPPVLPEVIPNGVVPEEKDNGTNA